MKGIKKGIIVGLLLGYMGLTSCAANRTEAKEKRSMDVQSLCKIQVEGYDGNASILAKIGYMPADEELSEEDKVSMQKLFDSITYVITEGPMSNLSNGDLVSFHTIYDEDLANYLAVVIENRDFTYEVRDLAKWELVDPFEGFCLHYYGAEPNGAYFFETAECSEYVQKNISFTADREKDGHLCNGDRILVSAEYDEEKLKKDGKRLTASSKEFVVEGLPEFPLSVQDENLSGIYEKVTGKLGEFLEVQPVQFWTGIVDAGTANTSKFYLSYEVKSNVAYYRVDGTDKSNNRLAIVYVVTVSAKPAGYGKAVTKDYYFVGTTGPVYTKDGMVDEDGGAALSFERFPSLTAAVNNGKSSQREVEELNITYKASYSSTL